MAGRAPDASPGEQARKSARTKVNHPAVIPRNSQPIFPPYLGDN